jgi:hypothetical protein
VAAGGRPVVGETGRDTGPPERVDLPDRRRDEREVHPRVAGCPALASATLKRPTL